MSLFQNLYNVLIIGLSILFLFVNSAFGQLIYKEDFSSDPGYTAFLSANSEEECIAQNNGGSYYAKVTDQSAKWHCVGISPRFGSISEQNGFTVEFDFNPVQPNWGHYPGIYFSPVPTVEEWRNLDTESKFSFKSIWSNTYNNQLLFKIAGKSYVSNTIPTANEWYHVKIDYHSESGKADLSIKRENGDVFYQKTGADFPLSDSLSYIFIGEIGGSPKYGDMAEVRVDNIKISTNASQAFDIKKVTFLESNKQICHTLNYSNMVLRRGVTVAVTVETNQFDILGDYTIDLVVYLPDGTQKDLLINNNQGKKEEWYVSRYISLGYSFKPEITLYLHIPGNAPIGKYRLKAKSRARNISTVLDSIECVYPFYIIFNPWSMEDADTYDPNILTTNHYVLGEIDWNYYYRTRSGDGVWDGDYYLNVK